jgi:5-methylcytosine-specific restriction endonuclease McrA
MRKELSKKAKQECLRIELKEWDGTIKEPRCHYCEIEERDFLKLWGKFYGLPYRGHRLEIDRRDTVIKEGNHIIKRDLEYTAENCVLACALCNMAKSNMFTHEEFHKVGKVIEEIWRERKNAKPKLQIICCQKQGGK